MNQGEMTEHSEVTAHLIEEALDALDMAAILFDEDARCVVANERFRALFLPDDPRGLPGCPLSDVTERMASAGRMQRSGGISQARLAVSGEQAIRGFARDRELPMADGGLVLETTNPTRRGGYLVTYRSVKRDRLGEWHALDLLSDAFESVEMGVVLWDAGLTVRRGNAAWSDFFGPLAEDASIREFAMEHLAGRIVRAEDDTRSDAAFIDATIAAAHDRPTQIDCRTRDGRRLQIATFPTQSGGVIATAFDVTERLTAETRARAMLEEVVESLDEGVVLYDADFRLRLSNDALHRHAHRGHPRLPYGTHLSEHCRYVMELDQLDLPSETTPEMFAEQMTQIMRTHARDVELTTRDGRLLELNCYPSTMSGYLLTLRDVTERRAADARAQEMLEAAVETLGEGVALYDSQKRLMMNNAAFRRLVFHDMPLSQPGTTLTDEVRAVVGAGLISIPDDRTEADILEWIEVCVETAANGLELPMTDGRILEVSNFHTKLGGYLISMRDVTERNRGVQATREADALVRTIVEASPTVFLVSRVDDGAILYHTPLPGGIGRDLNNAHDFFIDPRDRDSFLQALLPTGTLIDHPVRFSDPVDGTEKRGLISARIATFRGEQVIVSSARDITEQLAMQAELEQQRETAHQNEKLSAMGELLASVAHELNNPLSVVVGYAMMLEESSQDPVLARRIGEISAAAARCARIVKTFLAMARQRPSNIEAVDLELALDAAVEVAGYGLRASGAELDVTLDAGLCRVAADADQIVQVFSNLLVNAEHALKQKGEAGRLIVTARNLPDERGVLVRFRDNGPGIPAQLQSRVFEPFFTTRDVGEGTGIGLAFCHRIVIGCGGRIGVSATPGGGATFDVILPVAETCEAEQADASAAPPPASGAVLVVDDDETVGGVVGEILRSAGYRVQIVASAQEALDLCSRHSFAAIISDQRMPGMDGTEFHDALRRRAPAMARRLAFLTGDTLSAGMAEKVARSGRPCLEKPVAPGDLLALVARLTESEE